MTNTQDHAALTDDALRVMPISALLDIRTQVHAEIVDIEGQLASRGDAAKEIPFDPTGTPPERLWYRNAKRAVAARVAFRIRLKRILAERNREVVCEQKPEITARRSQSVVLCDLVRLLARYEFPDDDEAELRAVLGEAAEIAARKVAFKTPVEAAQ